MQDRFDYDTLWVLLDRIRSSHRIVRFADVAGTLPGEPFVILRHDVDYSTEAALALAEQEAARGVQATYFLLLNGDYYNLLDPAHAHVPARLTALGHEVGLHFDINFLQRFPRERWPALMEMQAGILGALADTPVSSVAMHQPGLYGEDPTRNDGRFVNAYADRYFREMTYVSDSCRAWRDSAWSLLANAPLPRRVQLALHPINWASEDRDRGTIFSEIHTALVRQINAKEKILLEQIGRHQGVLEHEARKSGVTPPEAR
jgi:hypothetical protein